MGKNPPFVRTISDRIRMVVSGYYGIWNNPPVTMTQEEIDKEVNALKIEQYQKEFRVERFNKARIKFREELLLPQESMNPPYRKPIMHKYFETQEAKTNGDLAVQDSVLESIKCIFLNEEMHYMLESCRKLDKSLLEQLNIRRLHYLQVDPEDILKLPDATVQKTLQSNAKRAILCTDAWEKYNSLLRNYHAIRDQVSE